MSWNFKAVMSATTPVAVAGPDSSGNLYVAEQDGFVYKLHGSSHSVYTDISGTILVKDGDLYTGILDMTMSPDGERLFVCYLGKTGYAYLAEITLDTKLLNNVMRLTKPDGGVLKLSFGSDGYLYITTPDMSKAGLGQNLSSLSGKVLRVDVSSPGRYTTPPDNPFYGYQGLREEIYAYGLHSPKSIVFDNSGLGYVVDERKVYPLGRGYNYGWDSDPSHIPGGAYLNKKDKVTGVTESIYSWNGEGPSAGGLPMPNGFVVGDTYRRLIQILGGEESVYSIQSLIQGFSMAGGTPYILLRDSLNTGSTGRVFTLA